MRDAEDPPALAAATAAFLTHPVFNTHHSETEMMRYIRLSSGRTSASTPR